MQFRLMGLVFDWGKDNYQLKSQYFEELSQNLQICADWNNCSFVSYSDHSNHFKMLNSVYTRAVRLSLQHHLLQPHDHRIQYPRLLNLQHPKISRRHSLQFVRKENQKRCNSPVLDFSCVNHLSYFDDLYSRLSGHVPIFSHE